MGKKKKKPPRSIRLLRPPTVEAPGILTITTGNKTDHYVFQEIRCDIGGRGFAMHRLGLGELYHVRVGEPEDRGCECMGYMRHGQCKHVQGLAALLHLLPKT